MGLAPIPSRHPHRSRHSLPHVGRWVVLALIAVLSACATELAAPAEPLRLLQPRWPVAYVGEPFDEALRPSGGLRPYRFEVVEGTLPPGLRLEDGRLRGTPTEVGSYSFTIEVQDGNLSQGLLAHGLEVRALPLPVLRVETPATEVRSNLPLVLQLEDARAWRGARVAIRWDPDAFRLSEEPVATDTRLVLFSEDSPGELLIEIAALGQARSGDLRLARFTLEPIDGPQRASISLVGESRYAGGTHVTERREGAAR